jgi:hypothetical protein
MQTAEGPDFLADFSDMLSKFNSRISTLEPVFDLCPGELMQNHLHHGELVKVGVKKAGDDHAVASAFGRHNSVLITGSAPHSAPNVRRISMIMTASA